MTNKLPKLLALATFSVAFFTIVNTNSASAATINVSTNDTASTVDADCTLREAIENINDQAQTNTDCAAGDSNNDTIIIPAGTVTLTANLPYITTSITIQGAGMGQTVIDGAGQWTGIQSTSSFTGSDFTVTGSRDFGLLLVGGAQLDRIEVNGANWALSDPDGLIGAIVANNNTSSDVSFNATNIYIHNFNTNVRQLFGLGIAGGSTHDVVARVSNITISDLTNTGNAQSMTVMAGLFDGGASTGGISVDIQNATVANITSINNIVTGLLTAGATQDTISFSASMQNSTFTNLNGGGSDPFLSDFSNGAVIGVAGAAVNSITANVSLSNILMANNNVADCRTASVNSIFNMSGTINNSISSLGGNITDKSCSAFTHPTDQNNITGLAATLSALADNGGYVPTMALKEGSPAIDSGITLAGLTTDARLATRPQGTAYDSGAYESPYSKPPPQLAASGEALIVAIVTSATLIVTVGLVSRRKFAIL